MSNYTDEYRKVCIRENRSLTNALATLPQTIGGVYLDVPLVKRLRNSICYADTLILDGMFAEAQALHDNIMRRIIAAGGSYAAA